MIHEEPREKSHQCGNEKEDVSFFEKREGRLHEKEKVRALYFMGSNLSLFDLEWEAIVGT